MKSLIERWGPRLVAHLNVSFDLTIVMCAAVAASRLSGKTLEPRVLACSGMLALFWAAETFAVRYYDRWANRSGVEETAMVSLLALGATLALGVLRFLSPDSSSLPGPGEYFLLLWPAVLLPRMLLFRKLEYREPPLREVLIVGIGPMAQATADDFADPSRRPVRIVGNLRFEGETGEALGGVGDLERCLRAMPVDEVYVAGHPGKNAAEMQQVVRVCERFGIPFALPAYSVRLERARPAVPAAVEDGYLHYLTHAPRPFQRSLKRLFDIFTSALALLVLSPVLLAVAALIKLTSKGPIFFKQARVGLHVRPFNMFKFRTMVVIDELPQLINVLRGDMSVVGPRPPVPREVAQYEPWQRRRLSVRPGLTCIWQVSGRDQISFQQWMYLDMRYIDHWSLAEDLSLILQTFPVVLTGRGAS
ncbi:MAG: sugar transferase [Myxococcales bacterium]|nr:sugar transferase [Myxococcales bacterium]